ncbi:hypothetical protein [Chryseobacterium sp. MP_3.2]|uniref:hypothetical protein n=1 Tax=Chryseobacterium sp. MP_3.2 TaxID=3071712 RepID=UPI002E08AFFC|nr:activator of HSP90 ATPase [Chryseobacterium sp. MP_3.2]
MKNLLIIATLVLLFSCKEKTENAVVAAENANVISSVGSQKGSRYSEGSSLIDAIYFELIKNDKELQALDDEINLMGKNSFELITKKKELLNKPTEYYEEVSQKITAIKDSVLKKEMQNFIKESLDKFTKHKTDLQMIVRQIDSNSSKINQYYDFFKIKKTLPEIEKYQNQNPLKLEEVKKMIADQNQLLEKLKNVK